MFAEILLSAGTTKVTVREVPYLLSKAIHPDVPETTEKIVSYLHKQLPGNNLIPAARTEPLNDDEWAVLHSIWHSLPPFRQDMTESEWIKYAEAFERAKHRPEWGLIVYWRNPVTEVTILQIDAVEQHKKMLNTAILKGEITPFNHAQIPCPDYVGEALMNAFITVEDFTKYVARFPSIRVKVEAMKINISYFESLFNGRRPENWIREEWNQVVKDMPINSMTMLTIGESANFVGHKYKLSDNAIKKLCDQLLEAVGKGLVVRDPLTGLIDASAKASWWYENVRADELDKWFESQGVTYHIQPHLPIDTEVLASSNDNAVKVSKAPAPISPIRGSYIHNPSNNNRQPRWAKWRLMSEVTLWEAVALSLNIEPEKVKTDRNAWMGADHPFDEGDDFNDRLAVIRQHSSDQKYFPTSCTINIANWYACKLRLDEFASWCTHVKYDIPPELKAMAQGCMATTPEKAVPKTKSDITPPKTEVIKGVTKRVIMTTFSGLYFDYAQWGSNLADVPKWLLPCRVAIGSKGKRVSHTWNPVLIGLALMDKGITKKQLNFAFMNLKEWSAEWQEKTELMD